MKKYLFIIFIFIILTSTKLLAIDTKAEQAIQKIGNDANRSLSKYLQEISRYEPLSPEKEVELALRVKAGERQAYCVWSSSRVRCNRISSNMDNI